MVSVLIRVHNYKKL